MINPPVTLVPTYLFITLAVFCFAAWGCIIPLPAWMQTLGLYLGMAAFVFACMCGLDWIVDRVTRYANVADLLDPDARLAESISRMNHDQLECLYNVYGIGPENVIANDYITLDDGTAVDRQAMVEIGQNANGIVLRPEREYSARQAQIRYAHDALTHDGTVEPSLGRRGPRIKDMLRFEKYVEMAQR